MMKIPFYRSFFALLLSLLFLPSVVWAQEQNGTVLVQPIYDGQAVAGGDMAVYQVASLSKDKLIYEWLPSFQGANLSLEGDQLATYNAVYAKTLTAYLDGVVPVFKVDDIPSDGLRVAPLQEGVYLFVQGQAAAGYEVLNPFLITIPSDGEYTVQAIGKMSPVKIKKKTISPDIGTQREKELPFTGQLWWPAYLLITLGIICIGASFWKRRETQ